MKIIIIDDESLARDYIQECLKKHPQFEVVCECADGFDGIKKIQELKPDLIFLDIQMPKINGFEMLELLDETPRIIFTTAFDEYAVKAFEVSAVDYLLKPFDQQRFDAALDKLVNSPVSQDLLNLPNKTLEESTRLVVKHRGEIVIIRTEDIIYLESWDDYIKVHAVQGTYIKKKTMRFYEESLENMGFVRCHRSYLVNIREISGLDHTGGERWELRLRNGFHLSVSLSGYKKIKSALDL